MKMTQAHVDALIKVIKPLDTDELRAEYIAAFSPTIQCELSDTRYRWDLFWRAKGFDALGFSASDSPYNDAHLDTALRAIVPPLLVPYKQLEYAVEGRGDFPIDMLRYDRARPATERDARKITNSFIPGAIDKQTIRVVGERCTTKRWASFNWTVVE